MGYSRDLDEYAEHRLLGEILRRAKLRKQGLCDYCERTPDTKPCKFPGRHRSTNKTTIRPKPLNFVVENEHADKVKRAFREITGA